MVYVDMICSTIDCRCCAYCACHPKFVDSTAVEAWCRWVSVVGRAAGTLFGIKHKNPATTMLPILPVHTKKKKKTVHRPRPQSNKRRCVAKPGSSAQDTAASSATEAPPEDSTVDEFQSAFQETAAGHDCAPLPQSLLNETNNDVPSLPQATVNLEPQDDQALVLAAEAAAALLDVDVGQSIDAAALLGVEDTAADVNPMLIDTGENCGDAQDGVSSDRSEVPITTNDTGDGEMPEIPVPALPPLGTYNNGPMGPDVKTFESKPLDTPMSCVHSNFLQYYYGNEAVGVQHALSLKNEEKKDEDEHDTKDDKIEKDEESAKPKALKSFCSKYPKRKKERIKTEEENEDTQSKKAVTFDEQPHSIAAVDNCTNNTGTEPSKDDEEITPQVEIVDGEIVVRPSTMMPNSGNRVSTNAIDAEFGSAVVEDEATSLGIVQAKYDAYKTKPLTKPSRWSVDETREFYRALRQCGPDFSMMQMFLPGRTRSQLKNKFKLEQRRHPRLVDLALDPKSRVKLDLSVFGELEIPDEVTPITFVQPTKGELDLPDETPRSQATDIIITETPAVENAQTAVQSEADIDRTFDHLFDDVNDVAKQMTDADKVPTENSQTLQDNQERAKGEQSTLLLAPISKPTKVKKTKKFKAKPIVKKAVLAKK